MIIDVSGNGPSQHIGQRYSHSTFSLLYIIYLFLLSLCYWWMFFLITYIRWPYVIGTWHLSTDPCVKCTRDLFNAFQTSLHPTLCPFLSLVSMMGVYVVLCLAVCLTVKQSCVSVAPTESHSWSQSSLSSRSEASDLWDSLGRTACVRGVCWTYFAPHVAKRAHRRCRGRTTNLTQQSV